MMATKTALEKAKIDEEHRHNKEMEKHAAFGNIAALGKEVIKKTPLKNPLKFINDSDWYTKLGTALTVANLPVRRSPAVPYGAHLLKSIGGIGPNSKQFPVPTDLVRTDDQVVTMYYNSVFGGADNTAHLNASLSSFRNYLRSLNSRMGGYEPGDLGQVLIASTELHVMMYSIRKMILASKFTDIVKQDIGNQIVLSYGVNPVALKSERAGWIAWYNTMVEKINKSIYIPKGFTYYDRKIYLATVVIDSEDVSFSETMHFVPMTIGKYNELDSVVSFDGNLRDNVYQMSRHFEYGYLKTLDVIKEWVDELYNNLNYSSALGEMYADLLHAFNNDFGKMQLLPVIGDNDQLEIVHTQEPLNQILNATPLPFINRSYCSNYNTVASYTFTTEFVCQPKTSGISRQVYINGTGFPSINTDGITRHFVPVPYYGGSSGTECLDLRQDSNGLLYQGGDPNILGQGAAPRWEIIGGHVTSSVQVKSADVVGGQYPREMRGYLNFWHDNISAEDVIVATRLTAKFDAPNYFEYDGNNVYQRYHSDIWMMSGGTEVIAYTVISKRTNEDTNYNYRGVETYYGTIVLGGGSLTSRRSIDDDRPTFIPAVISNNYPKFYLDDFIGNVTTFTRRVELIQQSGNPFYYDYHNVDLIDTAALQSLFTMDEVAVPDKFITKGFGGGEKTASSKFTKGKSQKKVIKK